MNAKVRRLYRSFPSTSFFCSYIVYVYVHLYILRHPILDKTPIERSRLLEVTSHFAHIHLAAATSGQTEAPPAEEEPNGHFTCFVQVAGRLLELDGTRTGPIDRGQCTELLTVSELFLDMQILLIFILGTI